MLGYTADSEPQLQLQQWESQTIELEGQMLYCKESSQRQAPSQH